MPKGVYERTQETKDNMSKAVSGENNPNYGKFGKDNPSYGSKRTQKVKNIMSKAKLGEKHPLWKGSEYQDTKGRWIIWVDGIKYCRARYVVMKCLGRELVKGETVHHINGDKSDDRPENLYLFQTAGEHNRHHHWKITPIITSNII